MATASAASIVASRLGQPCVLVVEDEFFVRFAVAEALRDAGYTVVEAVNGDEALEIIEAGVPLDLVFTDVRMPGSIDGLALLDLIKRSRPDLPVLVTSGHADPMLAINGGAFQFVRKPYVLEALVRLIQGGLEQSQ